MDFVVLLLYVCFCDKLLKTFTQSILWQKLIWRIEENFELSYKSIEKNSLSHFSSLLIQVQKWLEDFNVQARIWEHILWVATICYV
jgi:hypothetical protein